MLFINEDISGASYQRFIDAACDRCDRFTLIRGKYSQAGFESATRGVKAIENCLLKSCEVREWPGGGPGEDYEGPIIYIMDVYSVCDKTRAFLKSQECMSDWLPPYLPEDLCFYIGQKCWFFSTAHEGFSNLNSDAPEDEELLDQLGIDCSQYDDELDFELNL